MRRNTLIEHNEAIVVCEESGFVGMSYIALITTSKINARINL
jgi:hypothetical protein